MKGRGLGHGTRGGSEESSPGPGSGDSLSNITRWGNEIALFLDGAPRRNSRTRASQGEDRKGKVLNPKGITECDEQHAQGVDWGAFISTVTTLCV